MCFILNTTQDVTERKRAEAERERLLLAEWEARRQAEEAVRARDEFLSVAAHELKTPVTSLRGFAQVLLRQIRRTSNLDPNRLAVAMAQIDQQSERLTSLLNQLLDLSRIEAGKLMLDRKPSDIRAVVRGAMGMRRRLHPGRDLLLASPGQTTAVVDPLRLEQVIANLLDNAVKFSPPDSPVEVAIQARAGGLVRIEVRDHGIGVPEAERERVFERFYQAHGEEWHGGLGLGLYISKEIVQMHGGSIGVESRPDGGSLFVVLLPTGTEETGVDGG